MKVILLERVASLGAIGDVVEVRNGFARNFLIPQSKALLATERNMKRFETDRVVIEERNAKAREDAATLAATLEDAVFVLIRQAGDSGQLYGSVSARDIADAATAAGHSVTRTMVQLQAPIKTLGLHDLIIRLHPEVTVKVTANVARSSDEAERQQRGENVVDAAFAEQRAVAEEQAAELAEAAAQMDYSSED
jgi:large subunit ribosomal protein L9